ncbi:DUF2778 domain-containing protein [Rhizobiales bacterium RZME27]|jgi:hypothetical protein|uniref:DUF2778 domain-containing protein n=1 Tax=Endobacterium cereale TaxID=2663029 RepID=A0A6A8A8Z2_9HYPH|nr:DUF2778 domain-containing protein [Endobacterium cereale]MEB2843261.1 DUF2778 domain-containing protein [Endobacterium cereale]MQY47219.1 DUF2778 domain-containing protein [Endobacterium cereale]
MALTIDNFDNPYERPAGKGKGRKQASKGKSKVAFLGTVILGATLLGGVWVGAAVLSVGKMAGTTNLTPQPKFQTVLSMRVASPVPVAAEQNHLLAADADPQRLINVSKFSRIPTSVDAKSGRLDGAEASVMAALRPADDAVRSGLDVALGKAAAKVKAAEEERQFTALMAARPDADVIRSALMPAMENVVAVAPRGEMPDILQDIAPATSVAELKDIDPVEVDGGVELAEAEDDAAAKPTEVALAEILPKNGPMPFGRPQAEKVVAAAKPAKPEADGATPRSGLDAIARVSPQKPSRDDKPESALAFAKPDNPMRQTAPSAPSRSAPSWPGIGSKVAIYDITNATVHMPNGTKLEAHSGIGKLRDDPNMTHVKMKGPTPAGTYKLSMRESLFHGVAAIRLTSVDGKHPKNRTGLLAHSYLLRTRGDSHGCVAFAQYDKFLAAFRRGEITHMVIVDEWDGKRPGRGGSSSGKTLVDLFKRGNDA